MKISGHMYNTQKTAVKINDKQNGMDPSMVLGLV